MATAFKIAEEPASFADQDAAIGETPVPTGRSDRRTDIPSMSPDDPGDTLDRQRRFGDLKQNLTSHWKVQDR